MHVILFDFICVPLFLLLLLLFFSMSCYIAIMFTLTIIYNYINVEKNNTKRCCICIFFLYNLYTTISVYGIWMTYGCLFYSIQVFCLFLYFCGFSCDNTVLMCHSFVFVCLWCICIVIILNKFEDWWPHLLLT